MRRRERLVDVEVHHVEAGLAGLEPTHDRVEVGAVHVGQRAGRVDGLEQLADPRLEQAERRRVGDHDRGRPRAERRLERVDVHAAIGCRRDGDRPIAGHRRGRRVRPVAEIPGRGPRPGSVSPRARWYARIIRIPVSSPWAPAAGWSVTARIPEISASATSSSHRSWSVPWATSSGAIGWSVAKPRQPGRPFVELRVELHRARAERVEARVDRVVELAKVDVVADDVRFVHLGEGRGVGSASARSGSGPAHPWAGAGSSRHRVRGGRARRGSAGGAGR